MNDPSMPFMGAVSGDFESLELTETQHLLVDLMKSFGKMSAIVSESSCKFKVERVGGLESYAYQLKKAQDEGKALTPELMEELQGARYHEMESKIGNKTEVLRVLISGLAQNPRFRELLGKMVEEQMGLAFKRKSNREIAESTQMKGWEN